MMDAIRIYFTKCGDVFRRFNFSDDAEEEVVFNPLPHDTILVDAGVTTELVSSCNPDRGSAWYLGAKTRTSNDEDRVRLAIKLATHIEVQPRTEQYEVAQSLKEEALFYSRYLKNFKVEINTHENRMKFGAAIQALHDADVEHRQLDDCRHLLYNEGTGAVRIVDFTQATGRHVCRRQLPLIHYAACPSEETMQCEELIQAGRFLGLFGSAPGELFSRLYIDLFGLMHLCRGPRYGHEKGMYVLQAQQTFRTFASSGTRGPVAIPFAVSG
ncbi:hypothetical protein EV421DRAFT_1794311 [Armillaria borealis]|uniref:Protein kinase domain-containing protein n=1 Tax=Armillaria borealis TaxID=47425 RepID=A0AA39MTQ8_9AGAR|nr:hypothetical protein EV421DRAFT_1794311 [Armillaria borealis]